MSKFLYAILLTLALAFVAGAQTRRGAATTTKPKPSTGATTAKPVPQQTPAAKPTAPAAKPATPKAATAGAEEDCGCEDKPLPEVLASVSGVKITPADFSPEVQQQMREY